MDLPVNRTIAYALRRFAGSVTRRNACQLTGERCVNMVELKSEIMQMAEAIEGSGGEVAALVPFTLQDSQSGGWVAGVVRCSRQCLTVELGQKDIRLVCELHSGRLKVYGGADEPALILDGGDSTHGGQG